MSAWSCSFTIHELHLRVTAKCCKYFFLALKTRFTPLQSFSCACKFYLRLQSYVHFHKSYHTHANLYDVKLPSYDRESRSMLWPLVKQARDAGKTAFFAGLERLFVEKVKSRYESIRMLPIFFCRSGARSQGFSVLYFSSQTVQTVTMIF